MISIPSLWRPGKLHCCLLAERKERKDQTLFPVLQLMSHKVLRSSSVMKLSAYPCPPLNLTSLLMIVGFLIGRWIMITWKNMRMISPSYAKTHGRPLLEKVDPSFDKKFDAAAHGAYLTQHYVSSGTFHHKDLDTATEPTDPTRCSQ